MFYELSGSHTCLMGFCEASLLYEHSFADILDESSKTGYQRPLNRAHSLDFKKYISSPGSTTPPLTFNLRPESKRKWSIDEQGVGIELFIQEGARVLSQVDCQHRLGFMAGQRTMVPFITYVGLSLKEEMRVFNTINSKSKGLSGSLLDFHDSRLISNIESSKPELVIALRLNDDERSPWYKQLDLGGQNISGLQRRASLRTMQRAVKRFLSKSQILNGMSLDESYEVILSGWLAVSELLEFYWSKPRKSMLNKGIGVYSIMLLFAEMYRERDFFEATEWSKHFFIELSDFVNDFDWSNSGPLKGLGGEAGVNEALEIIKEHRRKSKLKLVQNG